MTVEKNSFQPCCPKEMLLILVQGYASAVNFDHYNAPCSSQLLTAVHIHPTDSPTQV